MHAKLYQKTARERERGTSQERVQEGREKELASIYAEKKGKRGEKERKKTLLDGTSAREPKGGKGVEGEEFKVDATATKPAKVVYR